jgi:hypothetical protein
MRRFSYRELRGHLPAMARMPLSKRAQRYLREHHPEAAREPRPKKNPKARRDDVRVYTITTVAAARGESVPHLRMSGHWLERYGFADRTRVFVRIEPGRLVLTTTDPGTDVQQRG